LGVAHDADPVLFGVSRCGPIRSAFKGKFKEVTGAVADDESLRREGRAQQGKADAQREAARRETHAARAWAERRCTRFAKGPTRSADSGHARSLGRTRLLGTVAGARDPTQGPVTSGGGNSHRTGGVGVRR
jgi:uncharacterized protein YjbJ (UPF0337 family)